MSWARWSGESDIYMFTDSHGNAICCGCIFDGESHNFQTIEGLLGHLEMHRAAGHAVPPWILDWGYKDWIEGDENRQAEARRLGVTW